MTVYLLNTTVIPCGADGLWEATTLPLEFAKRQASKGFVSAVGHESTAAIMSELLGRQVPVSRAQVAPVPGDKLLCFKLKKRVPEGAILSKKEINELGYEWVLMEYHKTIGATLDAAFAAQAAEIASLNQRVY
jgi:hypothetical protein